MNMTNNPAKARSGLPRLLLVQAGLALGLFMLVAARPPFIIKDLPSYLPLHSLLEALSVAAALMIFTTGWFSFSHVRAARFQILACAFLSAGLLDFFQTLSYPGMPDLITTSGLAKAMNFWLPARLITAMALLAAVWLSPQVVLNRRQRAWLLGVTLAMTGGIILLGLFVPETAPSSLIPANQGTAAGIASFKFTLESLVMTLQGSAIMLLIRGWRRERGAFCALLATGIWMLLLGEFSLMRHFAVADLSNVFGHLEKAWGSGLIFWAIYTQALEEPYQRLRQSEQQLTASEAQTRALLRENQMLLDNAFVGIFFVQDRRFIRVNRGAETLFGYAPGALNAVSTELIYPDRAAWLALGERAYPVIARGEIFTGEVELMRQDGSRFWCLMRAQALTPGQPVDGSIWIMEDATERRTARQTMEDAAELYRAIFESRNLIKILIDPSNGRILDANQAAADFYGHARDILRQRSVWEFSDTPRETLLALFAEIMTGQMDMAVEIAARHRRFDGERRDMGIYLNLIRLESRRLLLATVLDLTERKRTEAALADNLVFQKQLLETIPAPIFFKDLDGRYQVVNRAFTDFWGGSELLGKTVYDCWPRATADLFAASDQVLFDQRGVQVYETQVTNARSERRDAVFYKATLHAPDGSLRGLIGFILDITERKAADAALAESESRFRTLFTASKVAMLLIDPKTGEIVDANLAAANYYGYSVAQLRSMTISAINTLPPEQLVEEMHHAEQAQHWLFHFQHRLASGDVRDVEVHSCPLDLNNRPLLYSIMALIIVPAKTL